MDNRTCFTVNLRDNLRCRRCGRRPSSAKGYHRGFEYHHVTPRSEGGPDDVDNLALLCRDCHLAVHRDHRPLPPLGDLAPPEAFDCAACGEPLDPDAVEMNCGWYRCHHCRARTHLFDHRRPGAARA